MMMLELLIIDIIIVIIYGIALIIFVMFFNKTFTDELSSIKSAFQSTHDKTASLIERMNTEITSRKFY